MPETVVAAASAIEARADLGRTPDATVRFWLAQLYLPRHQDEHLTRPGRRIVERYRDEQLRARTAGGNVEAGYNILWANVEVLKPVLYGREPKPDISRRHKDEPDPTADLGADILERALSWEDDVEEIDAVMQACVEDRLLPGRAVARVFYETGESTAVGTGGAAATAAIPRGSPGPGEGPGGGGALAVLGAMPAPPARPRIRERAPIRYVFWEDYRESPARTESEIWWKAYRSYLTREQLVDRFGEIGERDRKSTRLNSSHLGISYAVFCLKKKKNKKRKIKNKK